jgi:hypothetical protein
MCSTQDKDPEAKDESPTLGRKKREFPLDTWSLKMKERLG